MTRRSHYLAAFALSVTLATASSCGGASGHPATAAGLEDAARAQIAAFLKAPGTTYGFLSRDCRKKVSRAEWGVQMAMATSLMEGMFGIKASDLRIGKVTSRNVTATTGEASVEVLDKDGKAFDESGPNFSEFIYENGDWRSTDCENMSDAFDDTSVTADTADATTTTYGGELVPADEAKERAVREASADGVIGEPASIDGLTIVVSSITFRETLTEEDAYTVNVAVRVENRTGDDQSTPQMTVVCEDGSSGSWYADSTFDPYRSLPSGSYGEGNLILSVPRNCANPVVRAKAFISMEDSAVDWAIPAAAMPGA